MKIPTYFSATMNHPDRSMGFLIKNRMSEAISIFDVGRSMFDVHFLLKANVAIKVPFNRMIRK